MKSSSTRAYSSCDRIAARLLIFAAFGLSARVAVANTQPLLRYSNLAYPTIDVDLDPITKTSSDDVTLTDRDGTTARPSEWEEVPSPIAIALVVEANLAWMRTDVAPEDDVESRNRLSGFDFIQGLLREAVWTNTPAGSTVTIVTYDEVAKLALAPTAIRSIPSNVLGRAEDFNGVGQTPSTGLRLAIDQLREIQAPRKMVILVGNGVASDAAKEADAVAELVRSARAQRIDLGAIVFDDWITDPDARRPALQGISDRREARTIAEGANALSSILENARSGYHARFDLTRFAWDGEIHQWTLVAGEHFLGPYGVYLPEHDPLARPSPWRWPLAGLALLALAGLVRVVR